MFKKITTLCIALLLFAQPSLAADTLWHFYTERGEDLPHIDARAQIYNNVWEDPYTGSYEQNIRLLGYLEDDKPNIGFSPTTGYSKRLSESITAISTIIPVTSVLDKDGITLPCSATNKCYFNIEQGTTNEEGVVCTGISGSSITNCVRGLVATGRDETGSSTLANPHNAGSRIIMTNIAQFYSNYVNLVDDQTIAGDITFSGDTVMGGDLSVSGDTVSFSNAVVTASATAPTLDTHLANKKYVDDTAIAGAPNASETVKGISELATRAEMAAGTATGGTGASLVLKSEYSTETPGSTQAVVVSESDGKINQGWIDLTENFTFTGTNSLAETTFTADTTWNVLPEYDADPTDDDDAVKKSYVDGLTNKLAIPYDQLVTSDDDAISVTGLAPLAKYKEIEYNNADGVIRVKVTGEEGGSGSLNVRIYINGSQVFSDSTTATETFSYDATVETDDLVQIYAQQTGDPDNGTLTDFRLYYLVTNLPVADTIN